MAKDLYGQECVDVVRHTVSFAPVEDLAVWEEVEEGPEGHLADRMGLVGEAAIVEFVYPKALLPNR